MKYHFKSYVSHCALLCSLCLFQPAHSRGQGVFTFWNPGAPTYVGVWGGPLAGPGIWAQALVGLTTNSLSPLGLPEEHGLNGLVWGQSIGVPDAPFYSYVQVQMAVWDGTVSETNYANVPANRIGFTDIVPVEVVRPTDLTDFSPHFSQSAVVPLIPEPSTFLLLFLTGCVGIARRIRRGQ